MLSGFDFDHWHPRLILVEDHVGTLQTHHHLTGRGYQLIRHLGNNGWYVSAELGMKTSAADRWEIIRKYYLALPFRVARNASRRVRRLFSDLWVGR